MIGRLYGKVRRISTGRWVLVLGLLFMAAAYLNVAEPYGIARLEAITGGVGALDEMSYDAEGAYEILEQQGEAGRTFYRQLLLSTEIVFPLVYRLFDVVFISYVLSRWLPAKSSWNYLCLLPLVGMLADYLENSLVLTMLFNYPNQLHRVAAFASKVTAVKWLSNFTDWTLIIFALLGLVLNFVLTKRRPAMSVVE